MKPALSPTTTGILPIRAASALTSSTTSSSVTTVRITSTNFSTGAGLKKCMPTTRRGLWVATEISVTDSEEVLVARTASGFTMVSSAAKISRLRSRCSGTASTTRSHSARSARSVEKRIRPSRARWSSSAQLAARDRAAGGVLDVAAAPLEPRVVGLERDDGRGRCGRTPPRCRRPSCPDPPHPRWRTRVPSTPPSSSAGRRRAAPGILSAAPAPARTSRTSHQAAWVACSVRGTVRRARWGA